MSYIIRCLHQGPYFTRTQKTTILIAALTVCLFLLPGPVYSEEVYLSCNANQESDPAGFITSAQPAPTARPANLGHGIGGRLVILSLLLLIAVAAGRQFKPWKSFKPTAKALGIGCLSLLAVLGTAIDSGARDTTPPKAPTGLTVSLDDTGHPAIQGCPDNNEPCMTTNKETYDEYEQIRVDYYNMPGNQRDWIGIHPEGTAANNIDEWHYTQGSVQGTMTFSGLEAGSYEAWLGFDDSWDIETTVSFTVLDNSTPTDPDSDHTEGEADDADVDNEDNSQDVDEPDQDDSDNDGNLPDYMQLPYPIGESWVISPAHVDNWDHPNGPRNSLDFSDGYWDYGDKPVTSTVVASGPGIARWGCPCYLEIDHGDGWVSSYYHMDPDHQLVENGEQVEANQPVGRYADTHAEATCCGGGSGYQHLHWSIWKKGEAIPVEGLVLSGWTVHAGNSNYDGNCNRSYFERDGEKRCPWDPVLNEGTGGTDTSPDADADADSDTDANADADIDNEDNSQDLDDPDQDDSDSETISKKPRQTARSTRETAPSSWETSASIAMASWILNRRTSPDGRYG